MTTPFATREIERLTEGWPGGPQDLELSTFAATFRSGRPELSAPALQRIGAVLEQTLDRQRRAASRRDQVMRRFRQLAPLSAIAAAVMLAGGAWLYFRPGHTQNELSRIHITSPSIRGIPVLHPAPAPVTVQPAPVN